MRVPHERLPKKAPDAIQLRCSKPIVKRKEKYGSKTWLSHKIDVNITLCSPLSIWRKLTIINTEVVWEYSIRLYSYKVLRLSKMIMLWSCSYVRSIPHKLVFHQDFMGYYLKVKKCSWCSINTQIWKIEVWKSRHFWAEGYYVVQLASASHNKEKYSSGTRAERYCFR